MTRHLGLFSTLLLAVMSAACSESSASTGVQLGTRTAYAVKDTVLVIGGTEEDTTLFRPRIVAFTNEGLVVWDDDRSQLLAFSEDGRLRWSYGAKGSGPGEFSGIAGVSVDDRNRLWVLDPENVRISILSSGGELIRAFRIPDVGYVDRLVPLNEGNVLLMGMDPTLNVMDERGSLVRTLPHPYGSYAALHPISAYNRAVHDPDADSTAFFFYYGGGFARTDASLGSVATLTPYVENIPFPEVSVERTENPDGSVTTSSSVNTSRLAARAGAVDDGVLHVLFQGDTDEGRRLIDRYSIGSGEYLGSWLLPDTAQALAVRDGLIATIVENPYPMIVVRRAPRS